MADTLESLEIEVKHKASGADSEIAKVNAQIEAMGRALQSVLPQLKQYADTLSKIGGKIKASIPKASAAQANPLPEDLQAAISNASQVDVLQAKLGSLRSAMQEAFNAGDTDKAFSLRGQILQTEAALAKAEKAANGAANGVKNLAKEAKKSQSPLDNLISSLKRIAFYRIIRGIIKSITQAFQEGLEKAYIFSSGVDGEGNRFAAAMDRMKSAGNAMKGQLGSAFIALLAAIEPIITALINLVTRAADAISQLLSAFTGTTYLKANNTAAKFADTMARGGAAAKEWRNQLLGFDEINRLNEPNQGGGGGGASPLDGFDFEESPIEKKWMNLANKIKSAIQWIQDHMEIVKGIAMAIGAAIAAWKLVNFLNNLLGLNMPLSTVLGLVLAIAGGVLMIHGAIDAIKNGLNWDNLVEIIAGAALYTGGLALAFGKVGAAVGLLVGGIVLLTAGFHDWIKTGELTKQSLVAIELGFLGIGVAVSLLTGSWIPLAVAAVAGAIVFVIGKWDKLIEKGREFQKSLAESLGNGKLEWQDFAAVVAKVIMAPIDAIIEFIGWIQALVGWCRSAHAWIQDVLDGLSFLDGFKKANSPTYNVFQDSSAWTSNFASGGFPSEGQLFVAREAGPEMVGTIGDRTAVANNDQIVEGIRQGVFEAVSAAMANNGTSEPVVKVYLDSREIRTGQQRLNRAMGV